MQRGRSKVSLMDLIYAGLIKPGQTLRFANRKDTQAEVTPRGTVLFRGVEYSSLSAAATAVTNTAMNGWDAWRVRSRSADWTKVSELRGMVETSSDPKE
jgi:Restriction Enzyme Adenine Methylase Associated